MRIAVDNFKGELPRIAARSLPEGFATTAVNCRLLSTDCESWRNFKFTEALCKSAPINTIYALHDPADFATIHWMHWSDSDLAYGSPDVDVATSTLAGDQTARFYFTGTDVPRWSNKAMATTGSGCMPVDSRPLGVVNPEVPPTLVVTGGGGAGGGGGSSSINFTDAFDDTSLWTMSSDFQDGFTNRVAVIQTSGGNPGSNLKTLATQSADCAYGYRNAGDDAANALSVTMTVQLLVETASYTGVWNFMSGIFRNQTGAGIAVVMGFAQGRLVIGTTDSWANMVGLTIYGVSDGAQPPGGTWVKLTINITRTQAGLCDVDALLGSVDDVTTYIHAHASDVPSAGSYIGFGNNCAPGLGTVVLRWDNVEFGAGDIPADTSLQVTTSYVYTFVADNGDGTFSESGPSPASTSINKDDTSIVDVTTPTSVPSGPDYHVVAKRIYRAISGATGTAFFLLAEIPLSQAVFHDSISDADAATGPVLPSEGWEVPHPRMRGILALPNDIYAGFHDNVLDLSAQGAPHAWPVKFRLATDKPIVGIGAIDTAVVIATQGFPYIAFGNSPDAYSMTKIEFPQSCVSKRSVCYLNGVGVLYASPDGMVSVAGPGQVELITVGIFTRKEWQALRPETMIATAHDNRVFVQYSNDQGPGAFVLESTENGFGKVSLAFHATAMRADLYDDRLYMVLDHNSPPSGSSGSPPGTVVPDGRTIWQFDAAEGSPGTDVLLPKAWTSKLYLQKKPITFRYGKIEAESFDEVFVTLIDHGEEYFTRQVFDQDPFSLPDVPGKPGSQRFQFRLTGIDKFRSAQFVEVIDEMQ
jgi:hypothetical protein